MTILATPIQMNEYPLNIMGRGIPRGVLNIVLDCHNVVSVFDLQSLSQIPYRTDVI